MFKLLTVAEKAFSWFKSFLQVFLSLCEIKLSDTFFKNEVFKKMECLCLDSLLLI